MNKAMLVAPALLALLASCESLSESSTSKDVVQPPLERIAERHDRYVQADDEIDAGERSSALLQSSLLMNLVRSSDGLIGIAMLRARALPVLSRYEVYVRGDEELTEFQRRVQLNTAKVLRDHVLER